MTRTLRVVDSITELRPDDAGCIAVSGSHGGISSAHYALAARPLLAVFNDAGVGKDAAGLAALPFLQGHGIAACTVGHASARIGEARSTLHDGVVSHCNALAQQLGCVAGQSCRALIEFLHSHGASHAP
ncbi:hypothetical protein [Ottowia sp.]|uniref:hypothetical protein n=1 Tax=Ottowia sp. TaxID=1898956 RepID=UPI002C990B6C|nr:hypothetical protein [Ottowia sp.]HOB65672.1 hypothetical protein [Ottowia sp.]HPZ57449.1 hypothetical protein [Ottowia sp.]HQD46950.1 hypothetical protein [Ottowia sp.]